MITVVGAVLTDDLDRPRTVLAARRTRPPALAGRWEFPGGKQEEGETPQAALARELAEELGLTAVRIGAEVVAADGGGWPIGPRHLLRLFLAVTDDEPAPRDGSHDALRRLDAADLDSVDWLDSDAAAVEAVRRLLSV